MIYSKQMRAVAYGTRFYAPSMNLGKGAAAVAPKGWRFHYGPRHKTQAIYLAFSLDYRLVRE